MPSISPLLIPNIETALHTLESRISPNVTNTMTNASDRTIIKSNNVNASFKAENHGIGSEKYPATFRNSLFNPRFSLNPRATREDSRDRFN